MELTLDRDDLKPRFRHVNCRHTLWQHFNDKAQRALNVIGRAVFYECDGRDYNVVYPPSAAERKE